MKPNREPAWKIANENRLQIFPKGSRQTYLTRPTKILPREALESAGVFVPPRRCADVLSKFGISAAARASYSKYYYISRGAKTAFNTVCFFLSASDYRAKFDGAAFRVSAGDVLLIPAKTPCDTSASRAETLWFEMPDTPFWRGVFGSSPVCKKAANLERMLLLADMYSEELYGERPNVSRLVSLGGLIAGLLRSEFGGAGSGGAMARLVEKIDSDISANCIRGKVRRHVFKIPAFPANGEGGGVARKPRDARRNRPRSRIFLRARALLCLQKILRIPAERVRLTLARIPNTRLPPRLGCRAVQFKAEAKAREGGTRCAVFEKRKVCFIAWRFNALTMAVKKNINIFDIYSIL